MSGGGDAVQLVRWIAERDRSISNLVYDLVCAPGKSGFCVGHIENLAGASSKFYPSVKVGLSLHVGQW